MDNPQPSSLKRRPSLRDLAKQLGVSHTTVNMALQGDKRITEALRVRICEFAEKEGYFPNDLAWGLRTGRTGLLGIVVPMVNSGYVSTLLGAAIKTFWEAGYFPITLSSELDLEKEASVLQSLARQRVEGVLLMPGREDSGKAHFAQLLKEHVPMVAMNNPIPKLRLPLVASDDVLGGELATRHLIQRGHKNVFHIGSPLDSRYADRRRELGYSRVMKEAGLKPRVMHYEQREGPSFEHAGFRRELERMIVSRKSTAVFCFNDQVALDVYAFCAASGIRIPDDLSVIGYSNESGHGRMNVLDFVAPPLTSVDQATAKVGEAAARALLELIKGTASSSGDLLLKPRLVERASVRKL